jgi:DNA invertase Pin-like site-specific DNA recombinase
MTTPKRLPLVAYRRVSTRGQVDRYGLPAQEADMRAYAKSSGVRILRVETDGGKTGILPADKRPALLAALRAVQDGATGGLLIPTLDRLARELTVQEAILGQVWAMGGVVHSADMGEVPQDDPDDPMRTAIRQMRGVFAQLDRALVIKKLRNGKAAKAAADPGAYLHGAPQYGRRAEGGKLVTDEAEAAVIARIAAMSASGSGVRAIAEALNSEGIAGKLGKPWSHETVARVLRRARQP